MAEQVIVLSVARLEIGLLGPGCSTPHKDVGCAGFEGSLASNSVDPSGSAILLLGSDHHSVARYGDRRAKNITCPGIARLKICLLDERGINGERVVGVGFLHRERHFPVRHLHGRGQLRAGGVPHFQLFVSQHALAGRIAQQKVLPCRIRLRREITRDGEDEAQGFAARIGRRTLGEREAMLQSAGGVVKPFH